MPMKPRIRKVMLTAHIAVSVGWIGAIAGFLVLAVAGLASADSETVRAAYLAMDLTGWFAIIPLALASLLTGVIQSLGTEWGLFRHYWVLIKLLLTIFATVVLVVHTQLIGLVAHAAATTTLSATDLSGTRTQLVVAAAGGLLVLLVPVVLSVYKPRGKTRCGLRKQSQKDKPQQRRAVFRP